MYVNKCTKCGAEFETKNPKRVICPSCLYPDRKPVIIPDETKTSAEQTSTENTQQGTSSPSGENQQEFRKPYQNNYSSGGGYQRRDYQGGQQGGYQGGYQRRDYHGGGQQGGYQGGQGGYQRRDYQGGGQQGGYQGNQGGYQRREYQGGQQGGYQGGYQRRDYQGGQQGGYQGGQNAPEGGYPRREFQGGGQDQGGGFRRPYQGGGQGAPQGGFNRGGYQGGQRPGGFGGPRPGGFGGPRPNRFGNKPKKSLLISKEQVAQIEVLYKRSLPLPNPDIHEVIGAEIELEPTKVFFGINLVRQKMFLPKLPYPKRKLAVSPDQLMAIKNLYEPLLPLPPIGCHKIIASQLKMDEWRVHVGIGLVRKQMNLPRWNAERTDVPEALKNKQQTTE